MQSRVLEKNDTMKMIRLQFTLAVKNKQMQEYGYVCSVGYHNSVLFENNIF